MPGQKFANGLRYGGRDKGDLTKLVRVLFISFFSGTNTASRVQAWQGLLNQEVHQRVKRWMGDEMATFEDLNLSSYEASDSSFISTEGPQA